jgi:hypothetical protein
MASRKAGQWNRFEAPSKSYTKEEHERQRELISESVERRQAAAAETLINVTVVGPNPVAHGSYLYTQGQTFGMRSSLVANMVAQGRVVLA